MPNSRQGARRSDLGRLLADLRMAKGLSLRRVEEVTRNRVSNAYLSQLEKGKIHKPSPNVLHSLAAVYAVPYETLMEKAGYLPLSDAGSAGDGKTAAFLVYDVPAPEDEQLPHDP